MNDKFLLYAAATILVAGIIFSLVSFVAPERVLTQIKRAESQNTVLPDGWVMLAKRFHAGNGRIMYALGLYEEQTRHFDEANKLFRDAAIFDPKNLENYKAYVRSMPVPLSFSGMVFLLSDGYLPPQVSHEVRVGAKNFPPDPETIIGPRTLDISQLQSADVTTVLARSFYLYGASLRGYNPAGMLFWWKLAWETDPGVSYYAIAVSSAEIRFGHSQLAKEILLTCMKNVFAKSGCEQAFRDDVIAPVDYYDSLIIPYLPLKML